MTLLTAAFVLFVAFEVKHFFCDFPLQNRWMLDKFHPDFRVWFPALFAHAGVHALGTALIVSWALFFSQRPIDNVGAWVCIACLAVIDHQTHFIIDLLKVLSGRLERCKAGTPGFWWALGLDQMAHHLVQFYIVWLLVVR